MDSQGPSGHRVCVTCSSARRAVEYLSSTLRWWRGRASSPCTLLQDCCRTAACPASQSYYGTSAALRSDDGGRTAPEAGQERARIAEGFHRQLLFVRGCLHRLCFISGCMPHLSSTHWLRRSKRFALRQSLQTAALRVDSMSFPQSSKTSRPLPAYRAYSGT